MLDKLCTTNKFTTMFGLNFYIEESEQVERGGAAGCGGGGYADECQFYIHFILGTLDTSE